MGLQLVTPPAQEMVTLADAKAYLRVDFPDDDTFIPLVISQARAFLEQQTGLAFLIQTWRLTLDRFPGSDSFWASNPGWWLANPLWGINVVGQAFDPVWTRSESLPFRRQDTIYVPKAPVQAVSSITYLDETGQQQTLSPSVYTVDVSTDPARIRLSAGQSWPSVLQDEAAIAITFTAGYGSDPTTVPADLQRAVYMMIGYGYQSREAVIAEYRVTPNELPLGVQAIISGRQRPMLV